MIQEKYPKVFTWLFIGLIITFLTGYSLSLYPYAALRLNSGGTYIILAIIEIAIAIFFSTRLHKMSKLTAIICRLLHRASVHSSHRGQLALILHRKDQYRLDETEISLQKLPFSCCRQVSVALR